MQQQSEFNKTELKMFNECLDIDGLIDAEELRIIARILKQNNAKRILEIGTYKGRCSKLFIYYAQLLVMIDDFGKGGENKSEYLYHTKEELIDNIGFKRCVSRRYTIYDTKSTNPKTVKSVGELAHYDILWIDGDHRKEVVEQDLANYGKFADRIIGHDWKNEEVRQAVCNYATQNGLTLIEHDCYMGIYELFKENK